MLYAEFLERCTLPSFLDAHQRAFFALGGTPFELLYDRMRNVFLRQKDGKTEFTQGLVDLALHYGFTPRVAPAYAPWVKGKVERPFDFIREGFWRGYRFEDLAQANRDLTAWLAEKSARIHGTTNERVDLRFAREKPSLLGLPPAACDVSERLTREVRKDCTIRVEGNSYVVEHPLVGEKVIARKREETLRIYHDDRLIVTYAMPEGKGHLVQDERFYQALLADEEMTARKYAARGPSKGRARTIKGTISPSTPRYPIDVEPRERYPIEVETRDLSVYDQLGGAVAYESAYEREVEYA